MQYGKKKYRKMLCKKVCSAALAVVLCFSMIGVPAFAIEGASTPAAPIADTPEASETAVNTDQPAGSEAATDAEVPSTEETAAGSEASSDAEAPTADEAAASAESPAAEESSADAASPNAADDEASDATAPASSENASDAQDGADIPAATDESATHSDGTAAQTDAEQADKTSDAASQDDEHATLTVEEAIDFVYIDQTIVALGAEQNIAFGLKDEGAIEEATLTLRRSDTGAKITFEAAALAENAALFTFAFKDEADLAAYELDSIAYTLDGEQATVTFTVAEVSVADVTDEGEIVATAVGDGEGRPYAFDVVDPALAEAIEQSAAGEGEVVAYTVTEEGELEAHETIEEALEAADAGAQAADDYHATLAEEEAQEAWESMTEEELAALAEDPIDLEAAAELLAPEKAYAASDGVFVIGIDPGHGGNDSGAVGYGLEERDINWKIAVACCDELNTYYNVTAVLSRDYDEKPGLAERVDRLVAAGAKVVVSIHNNASGAGTGHGCEVWVPNDSSYKYKETHVVGEELGEKILDKLGKLGLTKRGVFTRDAVTDGYDYDDTHYPDGSIADYYTVIDTARRYGIPGIIVEHAFIDNASDAEFLSKDSNLKKLGIADAEGIAAQYGLKKTPESQKYLIMGDTQTTAQQMASYYESVGYKYPSSVYAQYGAATIDDFCLILAEEAAAEGVRAEVVFAQAMLETGWLQFGGDVKADQCNFCGLGATGGGNPGNSFNTYGKDSVRMGIRAQVQHLKAYASSDSLNNPKIDPRFDYVKRGCAPKVDDLGGKWASDTGYGPKIRKIMDALLAHTVKAPNLKLTISKADMGGASSVYVDGVEYPVTWKNGAATITLPDKNRKVLQTYEFNKSSSDLNEVYPTHMHVWFLEYGKGGYVLTRASKFDDVMKYAGSSIRITGKKGIRMITSVPSDMKTVLTTTGVDGYKLLEYGTVVARDSKLGSKSLTKGMSGSSGGYAYKKGTADNVFKTVDGAIQYTNVLVGFSMNDCKELLTMRSYMILKSPSGDEVILYGGPVHRSIGYIAYQNKSAFSKGSAAYNYVWDIIHAVYGDDKK